MRDARDYGPVCAQVPSPLLEEVGPTSEDCLTLNVHRPTVDSDPLPVMVWIHGGGFVGGSGTQTMYNSPELVERGIVLVTLNYRLGRLGFLAHPSLQEGAERVANFGLLDQIAALRWVHDNIGAFGGDPDNVTIFGESAGGISVNALMSSPSADGLFHRAISQSGFGREPSLGWDQALAEATDALVPLVGAAPTAADLRALPVDDVLGVETDLLAGVVPVVDDVLPRSVADTFAGGEESPVPYLNGTTDMEINGDFPDPGPKVSSVRTDLLATQRQDVLAAYGSQAEADRHLLADIMFSEPARALALAHADDAATFRYRFSIAPADVLESAGGAPHASELVFVFDDTARQDYPVKRADDLADRIADLWVDFATDGEPDGWPQAETGRLISFTPHGPSVGTDPWAARLDVVEEGYARLGEADPAS